MGNGIAVRDRIDHADGAISTVIYSEQKIIAFPESVCVDSVFEDSALVLPSHVVDAAKITWLQRTLLRSLDIVGSIVGILVLWPIMLAVSVAILIDTKGPVVYRQQRVGENGRIFTLLKFRTMVAHAEKEWGFMPASEDDERVTVVGKMLRETRLDELPQLFNVLKGDMSLVGPRPENLYRVNLHEALRGARLAVKPGITGLAQIRSLYDLKPEHKLKYDYLYIQRRSFLLNLYILIMTVPVVLKKTGW